MHTPVALCIFNRPKTTQLVFDAIRRARPSALFIFGDGPRVGRNETSLVNEAREIVSRIDWPCIVETNFTEINMGCGPRMRSGLDWVFSKVDRAIILEDDCLPDASFFPFCEELLERYSDNPTIGMISGNRYGAIKQDGGVSYYFSRHAKIWGWATWRRSWKEYYVSMEDWPELYRSRFLDRLTDNPIMKMVYKKSFDSGYLSDIQTSKMWAWRWSLTHLYLEKICIDPKVNLVKNIGFGDDATSTRINQSRFMRRISSVSSRLIDFPLNHPLNVEIDRKLDWEYEKFMRLMPHIKKIPLFYMKFIFEEFRVRQRRFW
jgi:hypothetical protein